MFIYLLHPPYLVTVQSSGTHLRTRDKYRRDEMEIEEKLTSVLPLVSCFQEENDRKCNSIVG